MCLMHCRDCVTCCRLLPSLCEWRAAVRRDGRLLREVLRPLWQGMRGVPDDKQMKACAEECRNCVKVCKAVAKKIPFRRE